MFPLIIVIIIIIISSSSSIIITNWTKLYVTQKCSLCIIFNENGTFQFVTIILLINNL
jgi:hypothetical protein